LIYFLIVSISSSKEMSSSLTADQERLLTVLNQRDRGLQKYGLQTLKGRQLYTDTSKDAFTWCEETKLWQPQADATLKLAFFDELEERITQLAASLKVMDEKCFKVWVDRLELDSFKDLEKLLSSSIFACRTVKGMNGIWPVIRDALKGTETAFNKSSNELPLLGGKKLNIRTGVTTVRTPQDLWTFEINATTDGYDESAMADVRLFYSNLCREIQADGNIRVDTDKLQYIQTIHVYWMTDEVFDKSFTQWIGVSNSGKSEMINQFERVMTKNFVDAVDRQIFVKPLSEGSHSDHLMKLKHLRLGYCQEMNAKEPLNAATMKQLTGNDNLNARALYKTGVSFRCTAKLATFSQNNLAMDGSDTGLQTRTRVIPMNFNQKNVTKAEREEWFALSMRMFHQSRRNACLAWYMEAAPRMYASQNVDQGIIAPAQCVVDESKESLSEMDSFGHFLEKYVEKWTPEMGQAKYAEYSCERTLLKQMYKGFCIEHAYTGVAKLDPTALVNRIRAQFPGQPVRGAFKGLRIKESTQN
jgi:hypothetical protein